MNILIVDDETEQLNSLRVGLKSKGFKVFEALNAAAALKQLNNDAMKIGIVLTDYSMPGMDGIELLKEIREKNKALPVIIMTAYGGKDLVIKALRNHCDSFIEKPFTIDELIHEIQRAGAWMVQNTNSHRLAELTPKFVHQINNPLMAIFGSAELGLLELGDTEAIKKRLNGILKATKKIQKINKQMIELGRSTPDEMEMVEIEAILVDCLNMFADLFTFKGISVEKDLNDHHLSILGRKFDLEQLFKNLILNAIDSMDGRPKKRLNIRSKMDRVASSISVYIEDSGCGIPEESMDKIFTPYFTSKREGTGLGLLVVKGIIEKHMGGIEVKSQIGKGTIFMVNFPAVKQELNL